MPAWAVRTARACGSLLSHRANCAASAGCLVPANTAVVEPPQLPERCSPFVHCGSGATAHFPAVEGAAFAIVPTPQTAPVQVAIWPESSALFQDSEKPW